MNQTAQFALGYLTSRGVPETAARGIVGNLSHESARFSPSVIDGTRKGDNGRSAYVGQWNGSRKSNFENYARATGRQPSDLTAQLDFVLEEMNPLSPYADAQAAKNRDAIFGAQTVADATRAFSNHYERPSAPHMSSRIDAAMQVPSPSAVASPPLQAPTLPYADLVTPISVSTVPSIGVVGSSIGGRVGASTVPSAPAAGRTITPGLGLANLAPPETVAPIDLSMVGPNRPNVPDQSILGIAQQAATAILGAGAKVGLISGKEDAGKQYGSDRHRTGFAGDFAFFDPDGNRVTMATHPQEMKDIAQAAAAMGATGIGLGNSYMGGRSIHIDRVETALPGYLNPHTQGRQWGNVARGMAGRLEDARTYSLMPESWFAANMPQTPPVPTPRPDDLTAVARAPLAGLPSPALGARAASELQGFAPGSFSLPGMPAELASPPSIAQAGRDVFGAAQPAFGAAGARDLASYAPATPSSPLGGPFSFAAQHGPSAREAETASMRGLATNASTIDAMLGDLGVGRSTAPASVAAPQQSIASAQPAMGARAASELQGYVPSFASLPATAPTPTSRPSQGAFASVPAKAPTPTSRPSIDRTTTASVPSIFTPAPMATLAPTLTPPSTLPSTIAAFPAYTPPSAKDNKADKTAKADDGKMDIGKTARDAALGFLTGGPVGAALGIARNTPIGRAIGQNVRGFISDLFGGRVGGLGGLGGLPAGMQPYGIGSGLNAIGSILGGLQPAGATAFSLSNPAVSIMSLGNGLAAHNNSAFDFGYAFDPGQSGAGGMAMGMGGLVDSSPGAHGG